MACLDLVLKMMKIITIDLLALSFRLPFLHDLYVALQIEMVFEMIVRTEPTIVRELLTASRSTMVPSLWIWVIQAIRRVRTAISMEGVGDVKVQQSQDLGESREDPAKSLPR